MSTCFFTGHRILSADKMEKAVMNLDREIERLIENGVTYFISGGALGFDQIAASLIVAKKEMGQARPSATPEERDYGLSMYWIEIATTNKVPRL